MIGFGSRIRRTQSAAWRKIDGQVAIVSTDVNRLRLLNPVGGFIWERLENTTLGELVEAVCGAYAIDRDRASQDVTQFISDLEQRGMIEVVV